MTLTGFDIHFDLRNNQIVIVKTPGTEGRAAAIVIKPSSEAENDTLKFAVESGQEAQMRGYFSVEINRF